VGYVSVFRTKEMKQTALMGPILRGFTKFTEVHNLSMVFAANSPESSICEERSWCREWGLAGSTKVSFLPREPKSLRSYTELLKCRWVLAGLSTLGYELLGLGVRVAFILPSDSVFDGRDLDMFGRFGMCGPFWTRTDDPEEYERVLTYVHSVSDEQWEKDSGWIRDQLIVHDYGNTILKRYVEGVLAGRGDVLAEEAGGGRG
jgi:surface carbohydrate biosynthesis protein